MRVISNKSAEYRLLDLVQNKQISVLVSRLKCFEYDLLTMGLPMCNTILHKYLRDKGMKKLIPKKV